MLLLDFLVLSLAASDQAAGEAPVRIAPVSIVDLEGGRVVPDRALLVRDGRIDAVTAAGEPLPEGVRAVDGRNRFALPGLIDSHVHLNDPEREARLMVAHGVVFARDMGGSTRERLELRRRAREGEFLGVDLVVTGTLVDGSPPYHPWTEAVCRTPEEGRQAVRALVESGVDQIKVYARLAPDVHRAILAEASLRGLRAVGHVPDAVTLLDAARAGQASNEHLTRADTLFSDLAPSGEAVGFAGLASVPAESLDARLVELAATGMVQCPTLVLNAFYARMPVDDDTLAAWRRFAPAEVDGWLETPEMWRAQVERERMAWPRKLELVERMHRTGNPLIVGTDLANPYAVAGYSVHCELAYLVAAGLTPLEALRAATLTPARFLGLEARLGAIAPGRDASFLLLDANPLQDLRNARAPAEVWVRGRRYPRAMLDRFAAEAALMALSTTPAGEAPALETDGAAVRGAMTLRFQQWDFGREEFAWSEAHGQRRVTAVDTRSGYGYVPVRFESRHEPNGVLLGLEWTTAGRSEGHGELTIVEGAREIRFGCGELELVHRVPRDVVLIPPVIAAEAQVLLGLALNVGEVRKLDLAHLRANGRRPVPSPWVVRRLTVEEVTSRDPRAADGFVLERGSERVELLLDARGAPIRRMERRGELEVSAVRE